MISYRTIGLMSGTSLDGVDVAYCVFNFVDGMWSFDVPFAKTYPYPLEWKERLTQLPHQDAYSFVETDVEYGRYLGGIVADFCKINSITPLLVASHGHTIFHRPEKHITSQIGHGATLAAVSQSLVVCDFRSLDVAIGGQGAPLVPIGDHLLFSEFDYCLNLGGFANISFCLSGKRLAYDICPFNIILNYLFKKTHLSADCDFDEGGSIAAKGEINEDLLSKLNSIDYYQQQPPKSLGREWLESVFLAIINESEIEIIDKMRTVAEHTALQISNSIKQEKSTGSVLVTGGGAYNTFIIQLLKQKCSNHNIIVPDNKIVDFKEALVFAFLGLLRYLGENNCLAEVTGAMHNCSSGCVYDGRPLSEKN